jgi:hypothetical protein
MVSILGDDAGRRITLLVRNGRSGWVSPVGIPGPGHPPNLR